jgi:hypothetical protein
MEPRNPSAIIRPAGELVQIEKSQLDALIASRQEAIAAKIEMQRDISSLLQNGRSMMGLFGGSGLRAIVSTATKMMRNPGRYKAMYAPFLGLFEKYQHLMPANAAALPAPDGDELEPEDTDYLLD